MDTTSFLRTLELEECYTFPLPAYGSGIFHASETREGFVDTGSVVCFNSNVQLQQRDVLESTLLAQLAANKKYDRFTDSTEWYKFYDKVIADIGRRVQSSELFSEYLAFPDVCKICDAVVEIFNNAELEQHYMMVLKRTFDRLGESQEGLTLFNSNSSSLKDGNFQILACTFNKKHQISAFLLRSHFKSNKIVRNYFFENMKKNDVHLFKSAQAITLDEDVYAQVREDVKKKLGKRTKDYVINLHIG